MLRPHREAFGLLACVLAVGCVGDTPQAIAITTEEKLSLREGDTIRLPSVSGPDNDIPINALPKESVYRNSHVPLLKEAGRCKVYFRSDATERQPVTLRALKPYGHNIEALEWDIQEHELADPLVFPHGIFPSLRSVELRGHLLSHSIPPTIIKKLGELTALQALTLNAQSVSHDVLHALPRIRRLQSLAIFCQQPLPKDFSETLARLPALKHLSVTCYPKDRQQTPHFTEKPFLELPGITTLTSCAIFYPYGRGQEDAFVRAIAATSSLESLSIQASAAQLVFLAELPKLSALTLGDGKYEAGDGFAALRRRGVLTRLDCGEGVLSENCLREIAGLPKLRELRAPAGDWQGLQYLENARQLRKLDLGGHHRSRNEADTAARALLDNALEVFGRLPELEEMSLEGMPISDESLRGLAASKSLQKLNLNGCRLNMHVWHCNNSITDAGVRYLEALSTLRELSLIACEGVSKEAVQALREKLRECEIKHSRRY